MLEQLLAPILADGITRALLYVASVGGVGAVLPIVIEALKGRVPFINQNHATILRVLSVTATVATGLGIGYTYDLGTGKLAVEGLTPINLAWFVLGISAQFGLTEWVYQRFLKQRR